MLAFALILTINGILCYATFMATDPRDIQLTEEQRCWLANLAEETGRSWSDLLDELFTKLPSAPPNGNTDRSFYDALEERGIIGAWDGPGDLSTNPKHMEGFGESSRPEGSD